MDVLLIVFLTLLNGIFAMSELALASSKKARLAAMTEAGDKGAAAALQLLENPTQFLSTVQVGITSIGILNGIVGEAAFSDGVAHWLRGLGASPSMSTILATTLVVTAITFTTIIFGELVPKRIGQLYPERVSRWLAPPMRWLARVARPFVWLLSISTQWVLKLLRIDNTRTQTVTAEEIAASLEEGVDAGLIEEHEHQMVRNVFHLDDRPLTSLMTPRTDIEWLDAEWTVTEALTHMASDGGHDIHSWYPVCRGGLDDVIGVVQTARLLALGGSPAHADEAVNIHMQAAVFVPETLTGMELLEQLRSKSGRLIFVVDEYGEVQGLVTPHDLLEAITGELQPGATIEAWATPQADGSWLLDGTMPIYELKARLGIDDDLPGEDKGLYNTLAGLLMAESGHLPVLGERIECGGWLFQIDAIEGRRIEKVRASRSDASTLE